MGTAIAFLLKFIAKILLIFWSTTAFSQNPAAATFTSTHVYCGYWQRPGVFPIDCPRWFQMTDSTEFHLFPLRMYLDSMATSASLGTPTNFLWMNSSSGRLQWSHVDSLNILWSQVQGAPTIPTTTSQLTNNSGFLTSINGSMVTAALGYTPYNDNTNNYITTAGARNSLSLTTTGTSGPASYSSATGVINVPAYTGTVSSVGLSSTDLTVSGSPVTGSGSITANLTTTGVVGGTYFGMFTIDEKGRVTAATTTVMDTLSPSRSFNTPYKMSTTNWVTISPSFSVSCTLSLTTGQSGEVYLEWSADGTSGWTRAALVPFSNSGSLTIGLNLTQINGATATLTLPPNYWWRLRTNNVIGTPTYTFTGGSKITY